MKPFPMPVRAIGPGSQPPEDEALSYLGMSREVQTFAMPRVPERTDAAATAASRDLLDRFLRLLETWTPQPRAAGPRLDLEGVEATALAVTNDMLGEGEVSIRVTGGRDLRIQETVFTGIWRVRALDGDGGLAGDWIEAGALPAIALEAARESGSPELPMVAVPHGVMNAPALLREIQSRMKACSPGRAAHVVNLTLLPVSADDHVLLEQALPVGPVAMISRGFGNCRITSTLARNVWRVQYFNNVGTLILNTIEVVEVPEEAVAAVEDLHDSRERLAELVQWMGTPGA